MRKLAHVSLLVCLVGCAMSYKEPAELDYGACPRDYEATVRAYFQDGWLPPTRYKPELVIWPPQRIKTRWAKTLPPGQLVWGYLVTVEADQTLGETQGLGLYGFLFRGQELVKQIDPPSMSMLAIDSEVAPVPLDERSWEEVTIRTGDTASLFEWVPSGESLKTWTELITMRADRDIPLEASVEWVYQAAERDAKRLCSASKRTILFSSPTELLYQEDMVDCLPYRDQYWINEIIRAPKAVFRTSYAKLTPFSAEELEKWQKLVGGVHLVRECGAE
jgi:hypothetical protein